jgi:hypothetical protein
MNGLWQWGMWFVNIIKPISIEGCKNDSNKGDTILRGHTWKNLVVMVQESTFECGHKAS